MRNVNANSTVDDPAQNVETARTVPARNVVATENSFWVLYGQHDKPTFLEDAGNGQRLQRDTALRHVKNWRVCLDIGSNIGQWTRPLANKFRSVICFEPNPNFRECFTKNIKEDNVVLWPYGLSDRSHSANQDFNSTVLNEGEGDIKCIPLDSYNFSDVDFVKIDVDGFEIPLLKGARKTLTNNSPVINIEMKYDKRSHIAYKSAKILKDLGYKFVKRTKSDEIWMKS